MFAVTTVAAFLTIPVVLLDDHGPYGQLVMVADWAIWFIFVAEYAYLLAAAPDRARFIRTNPLRLIVVVFSFPVLPEGLALVRVVRLVRLIRLASVGWLWWRALRTVLGPGGLASAGVAALAVVGVAGLLMVTIEPEAVEGDLGNAMWWATITATTVGYGDIAPKLPGGRLIATALVILGTGIISVLAASVAAMVVSEQTDARLMAMTERLERIEAELREQRS
jgi:voltage-gated potassium channel